MAFRFASHATDSAPGEPSQAVPTADRGKARLAKRAFAAALLASVLIPHAGCTMLANAQKNLGRHDGMDEFLVSHRNRAWSARAWLCNQQGYRHHPYKADLEAGFRQGYEDVAAGGSGCTPPVCPRSYWGWQYQSPDGQKRMNAWFEGYPLGVRAAEQDGIAHWGAVVTSFHSPAQNPEGTMPPWTEDHPGGGPKPLSPVPDPNFMPESIPTPANPEPLGQPSIKLPTAGMPFNASPVSNRLPVENPPPSGRSVELNLPTTN
ncbi:MAG: hypothetical protein EA381_13215 [Planctomycetaceae bacterium]|nr:MAG: hypothetical protein EA381_13215 [Planctomycetaceae bacterium]